MLTVTKRGGRIGCARRAGNSATAESDPSAKRTQFKGLSHLAKCDMNTSSALAAAFDRHDFWFTHGTFPQGGSVL